MSVAIIGGRGTGKSVFVGLLATSAINYAAERNRHFRYWTDPIFTGVIGDIVASLKLRRWPTATLKGTLSEYEFYFGYTDALRRALISGGEILEKVTRGLIKPRKGELFNVIKFKLFDISGEDVDYVSSAVKLAKDRGVQVFDLLPPNLKMLLDVNVLVFLVDSSRVTTDIESPKYREMIEYDNLMAQLVSLVAAYKSAKYSGRVGRLKLFPVIVFTKFDMVDRKILRSLGIPDNYADWIRSHQDKREVIRDRLSKFMLKFYRHSKVLVDGGSLMGVELERAAMFISYIKTELNEEGVLVPRVYSPDGVSYELDYSITEYKAFIEYFGKIAGEIKAERKEMEDYVTGLGG
ncbi:MAG: hypothetical protein GSR85_00690 [Desulfurococcales archaeon]|nr:hypothetical protein [Desulfurococcales archaeon]